MEAAETARVGGRRPNGLQTRATLLAVLSLAAYGAWRATSAAWVCDDSFISFRYAENLVAGHGLVYNIGERVEGYTNFLWTLLVAGAVALGASPILASQVMGIVSLVALAAVLGWNAHRREGPLLPLAAAWVLLSDDFHVWATGGLETMTFAALAAAGLLLSRRCSSAGTGWGSGACFALLVLTRLDGVLFVAVGAAAAFLAPPPGATRWRAFAIGLPTLIVMALWLPAKLVYYGELLPTAFYSKSVLNPYWGQGLIYVGLFLAKHWGLALALVVACVLRRAQGGRAAHRVAGVCFCAAALYTAYLVHVGGDFMFARRLIPVVPLLLVGLEEQLAALTRPILRWSVVALVLLGLAFPWPIYHADRLRVAGVSDEPRFYPSRVIEARRLQAETVARALEGTPARVAFEGGMCAFGYYSRLPYQVEVTGLTQYSLARQPLVLRGLVGHEKVASARWLQENRIHIVVEQTLPPLAKPVGPRPQNALRFGDVVEARIAVYDDEVMQALRRRSDVSFLEIEPLIERTRRRMEAATLSEAEALYQSLDAYYLAHAGERGKRLAAPLLAVLEQKRRVAAP